MSVLNFRKVKYERMSAEDLFWEIGTKEKMDSLDQAYWDAAIAELELTDQDLRDIAVQCLRRKLVLDNT